MIVEVKTPFSIRLASRSWLDIAWPRSSLVFPSTMSTFLVLQHWLPRCTLSDWFYHFLVRLIPLVYLCFPCILNFYPHLQAHTLPQTVMQMSKAIIWKGLKVFVKCLRLYPISYSPVFHLVKCNSRYQGA